MAKLIMRDIQADDIILEKTLTSEKANALKQVLDLYTDPTKLEVKIIEEEKNDRDKRRKRSRKV